MGNHTTDDAIRLQRGSNAMLNIARNACIPVSFRRRIVNGAVSLGLAVVPDDTHADWEVDVSSA